MCFGGGGDSPTAPVTTPGYSVTDSRSSLDITDTKPGEEPKPEENVRQPAATLATSKATGASYNALEV